jgi:hypothetical protein
VQLCQERLIFCLPLLQRETGQLGFYLTIPNFLTIVGYAKSFDSFLVSDQASGIQTEIEKNPKFRLNQVLNGEAEKKAFLPDFVQYWNENIGLQQG